MNLKQIDQRYSISDQLTPEDLDALAAQGTKLVVNFRPDGEGGESQPTSEALASQAAALGMAYAHIPVVPNQVNAQHVTQLQALLTAHQGPVVGFCRTGNRANTVYQQALQSPVANTAGKPACCCGPAEAKEGLLDKVKGWFKE
jgi:uncharacterized protein (TIGR01244 family)